MSIRTSKDVAKNSCRLWRNKAQVVQELLRARFIKVFSCLSVVLILRWHLLFLVKSRIFQNPNLLTFLHCSLHCQVQ